MFNLLPESIKNKIISDYKVRRFVVAFSFIVLLQVSFIFFLLPSWFNSYYKEVSAVSQTNEMTSLVASSNTGPITDLIKEVNAKLDVIDKTLVYPKSIPVLDKVLNNKPETIRISEISLSTLSSTDATISLHGISANREALLSFSKNLQGLEGIKNVELPISNFTKDKNIEFSINITVSSS